MLNLCSLCLAWKRGVVVISLCGCFGSAPRTAQHDSNALFGREAQTLHSVSFCLCPLRVRVYVCVSTNLNILFWYNYLCIYFCKRNVIVKQYPRYIEIY